MGDEHERNAEFFVDIFEQPKDRLRGHGVKSTRSFIAEHDRWTIDERTRDRHALLLSTRKLRRILVRLVGKTYQLQQFERTLARFSLVVTLMQFEREGDVAQHRSLLEEREVLEDHAHVRTKVEQRFAREVRHIHPIDDDLARSRTLEQVDAAHQGRFSRA